MSFNDQQQAIAEGKSRRCIGKKFVEQTWGYTPLAYHGAEDFLVAQRLILEGADKAQRILHKKIYVAGVLADEMGHAFQDEGGRLWFMRDNVLLWFKRNTGTNWQCVELWKNTLDRLLEEQQISL